MATRQTGIEQDLAFGKVIFAKPADAEDSEQGIDAWLGGIPFAWRRRRIPLSQYNEISIRFSVASGGRTEYLDILPISKGEERFLGGKKCRAVIVEQDPYHGELVAINE